MAREARYTENVSFLASLDMKVAIEEIAEAHKVSAGEVWRRAVEVGIDAAGDEYARAARIERERLAAATQ